jgi:hypothetical protein
MRSVPNFVESNRTGNDPLNSRTKPDQSPNPDGFVRAELFSIKDTMKIVGLKSPTSIYAMVKEGQLEMRKVLGCSRITRASIERLLSGR